MCHQHHKVAKTVPHQWVPGNAAIDLINCQDIPDDPLGFSYIPVSYISGKLPQGRNIGYVGNDMVPSTFSSTIRSRVTGNACLRGRAEAARTWTGM